MKENDINKLWKIMETILQLGNEQLAYSLFDLFIDYTHLNSLRHIQTPVLIDPSLCKPIELNSILKDKNEKSWASIAVAYRYEKYLLSQKCFYRAVNENHLCALNAAIKFAK